LPNSKNEKAVKQLYSAVEKGNLDWIRELITNNRLLIKEVSGMLLLCEAVKAENIDVVRLLIELGAEVNDEDRIMYDNEIPLSIACYRGKFEIARLLIDAGATIDTVREDPEYFNPLMCAVCSGNLDLVKLLVDRGADVNVIRAGGTSALSIAIHCKHLDLIDYLTPLTDPKMISKTQ
jgi:ankyrin repeat protein